VQHAAHLRQPADGIGDVLDHLPGPHHIEARVRKRPGSRGRHLLKVELGMAQVRAPQRLGGNVDPHHPHAHVGKLGSEASLATAHVQHSRPRRHMIQQKCAPQFLLKRGQPLGHTLPQSLVVVIWSRHPRARLNGRDPTGATMQPDCHLCKSLPEPTMLPYVLSPGTQ